MSIEVRHILKTFGKFIALKDVSLHIPTGELVALLGPSGSGKTTLLRIIAGLETPDAGTILFQGEDATNQNPRERQVGFVFQHYALFRHMTVFENIAFGLRVRLRERRPSKREISSKVHRLLRLVQLDALAEHYPSQLSGGQRQRVALARALAVEPQTLLLDEPFGALDAKVRQDLRRWLRRLHDELHVTSVFVTHDQEEALEVADRVVVMNKGQIEQVGAPEEVYDHPATPFVHHFLGHTNIFHGRVDRGQVRIGTVTMEAPEHHDAEDAPAIIYVRPHDIEVEHKEGERGNRIGAVISHIRPAGPTVRLDLKIPESGERIEVDMSKERYRELALKLNDIVFIRFRTLRVYREEERDSNN